MDFANNKNLSSDNLDCLLNTCELNIVYGLLLGKSDVEMCEALGLPRARIQSIIDNLREQNKSDSTARTVAKVMSQDFLQRYQDKVIWDYQQGADKYN